MQKAAKNNEGNIGKGDHIFVCFVNNSPFYEAGKACFHRNIQL